MCVLQPPDWTGRAAAHQRRADALTAQHRERAVRGESHPVWDFLFTYYSLRPRQLRVWHPGYGTVLAGEQSARYLDRAGYIATSDGVTIDPAHLRSRIPTVRFVAALLAVTSARMPQFGCFAMHEWAMVYRAGDRRHQQVPLRLGSAGTDTVVEARELRCTHFDAYRFFTPPAVGRNSDRLTRTAQIDAEQPGCLHATMDLYKWCYKLGPLIESTLLLDCLDLAFEARRLDMQASPYDLRDYGLNPITVEEPGGRAEYIRRQSVIVERATPLRAALLERCERLLAAPTDRIASRSGRQEQ